MFHILIIFTFCSIKTGSWKITDNMIKNTDYSNILFRSFFELEGMRKKKKGFFRFCWFSLQSNYGGETVKANIF